MHPPLTTAHHVARLRPAVDLTPPAPLESKSAEAFAPQLARACERGNALGTGILSHREPSLGSHLTEAPALRPWEPGPAEDTPAPPHGESADADDSDEDQSHSSNEDPSESSAPPTPPTDTPPVTITTPLALPLMGGALAAGEGEGTKSSSTTPEIPPESVGSETTQPGGPPPKLAAKSSEPGSVAPSAASPLPASAKAGVNKTAPVPATETPPPPAPAGGTSAAPLSPQMNLAQDMNKTSGQEEQNLPPVAATAQMLAIKAGAHAVSSAHAGESATAMAAFVPTATETAPMQEKVTHVAPVDPTAKVAALMATAVVRFRQNGDDDFTVTIQPDPDTEIWLRVSLQGQGTEMHAELRRGDSAALAARWPELQERLAQQGVKLAAFSAGEDLGAGSGQSSGFSSPQQQAETEGETDSFGYAAVTTTTNTLRRAPASPGNARGWETWA